MIQSPSQVMVVSVMKRTENSIAEAITWKDMTKGVMNHPVLVTMAFISIISN